MKVDTLPPDASVMLLVPLLINGIFAAVVMIALTAPMLPTLALPEMLAVPVMFAPVPVTVNTLLVPAALIVTFPLSAIRRLLVPFAIVPITLPPKKLLPAATYNAYGLVIVMFVLCTGAL